MAPVDPSIENSNTVPIAILFTYVASNLWALARILLHFREVAGGAVPSRTKDLRRRRHIRLFATLAGLSFLVTFYHQLAAVWDSYSTWLAEHGRPDVHQPPAVWEALSMPLQLGRWWRDSRYFESNLDVLWKNSRRTWWTQQWNSGAVAWMVFLGIEGRRRGLSRSTILAFTLVSSLLGLAVAQNLFSISMLLTPGGQHRKPLGISRPYLLTAAASLVMFTGSFASWLQRLAFKTSGVDILTACAMFLLPHFDLLAAVGQAKQPRITNHNRRSRVFVFRSLGLLSAFLFAKQTYTALVENAPSKHQRVHNFTWNMHTTGERSRTDRFLTAVSKVLGAIDDHPVAGLYAWDVLLSGVTLAFWTALHGVDAAGVLDNSPLSFLYKVPAQAVDKAKHALLYEREETEPSAPLQATVPKTPPPRKARGRPRKNGLPFSPPTRAAASTSVSATPASQPGPGTNSRLAGLMPAFHSVRESLVSLSPERHGFGVWSDSSGDESAPVDIAGGQTDTQLVVQEAESAALTWGLFAAGGLGAAMASVFGAEAAR